ncbi:MAG: glycoprotein [Sanya virga-like virus 2]|nr:MAG: glycoprotein [Sanya virga-like virus 2]
MTGAFFFIFPVLVTYSFSLSLPLPDSKENLVQVADPYVSKKGVDKDCNYPYEKPIPIEAFDHFVSAHNVTKAEFFPGSMVHGDIYLYMEGENRNTIYGYDFLPTSDVVPKYFLEKTMLHYDPILDKKCLDLYHENLFGSYKCQIPSSCQPIHHQKLEGTWYGSAVYACYGHPVSYSKLMSRVNFKTLTKMDKCTKSFIPAGLTGTEMLVEADPDNPTNVSFSFTSSFIFNATAPNMLPTYNLESDWNRVCFHRNSFKSKFYKLPDTDINSAILKFMSSFAFKAIPDGRKTRRFFLYKCDRNNLTVPEIERFYYYNIRVYHFNVFNCSEWIPVTSSHLMCSDAFDLTLINSSAHCPDVFTAKRPRIFLNASDCYNIKTENSDPISWAIRTVFDSLEPMLERLLVVVEEFLEKLIHSVLPLLEKLFLKILESVFKILQDTFGDASGFVEEVGNLIERFLMFFIDLIFRLLWFILKRLVLLEEKFYVFEFLCVFLLAYYFSKRIIFAVILTLLVFSLTGYTRHYDSLVYHIWLSSFVNKSDVLYLPKNLNDEL